MAKASLNLMSSGPRQCVDFGQILDQKANVGTADMVDIQNLKDSVVQICDYLGLHKRNRLHYSWIAGKEGIPGLAADYVTDLGATHAPLNREMIIVGAAGALSALATVGVEGGVVLTTGGTGDDEMSITPNTTAEASGWAGVAWSTDREPRFECDLVIGASLVDVEHSAGLSLTLAVDVATDNDFVKFWLGDGDANWQLAYQIGGTGAVEVDTGVVAVINTRLHFIIDVDEDRIARCYIDGVLVATTPALTDTLDTLLPFITIGDTGAAARAMTVYSVSLSREYGA